MDHPALVYIVDDEDAVRRSISRLLKAEGYTVKAFSCALAFLGDPPHAGPCCLLLDKCLPDIDGLQLQRELCVRGNYMPIVFITGFGDIPSSVRAIKAGAFDFLEKPIVGSELLRAVSDALAFSRASLAAARHSAELADRFARLTDRERQVFTQVVTGKPNKQIAHALGISEKTIKVHRARLMTKMKATSLAELVRFSQALEVGPAIPSDLAEQSHGHRLPGLRLLS